MSLNASMKSWQVSRYAKWKVIVKGNKDQEYIFKFLYASKLISVIWFWFILICFKISSNNWIGKKYNIVPDSWQVQAGCNSTNHLVHLHTSMSAHIVSGNELGNISGLLIILYDTWFLSLFWHQNVLHDHTVTVSFDHTVRP